MTLDTNITWKRLERGSRPRQSGANWGKAGKARKATSCCLCPLRFSSLQLSSQQSACPLPRMNLLLPSRQSKARNAVRLSMFVVAPYLGSYLFLQIPHYGSPALHGGKKKGQFFFSTPLNCHEAILYLQMQIHCWQSTGLEEGWQRGDPGVCNHVGWCLDFGDIFFFRLLWRISPCTKCH